MVDRTSNSILSWQAINKQASKQRGVLLACLLISKSGVANVEANQCFSTESVVSNEPRTSVRRRRGRKSPQSTNFFVRSSARVRLRQGSNRGFSYIISMLINREGLEIYNHNFMYYGFLLGFLKNIFNNLFMRAFQSILPLGQFSCFQ